MILWQTNLFGRATLNMVLKNQLAQAYAELDRELQAVGRIQRSLLPRELPDIDRISLAARYETARRAGGDFYDLFPLSDGSWGLLIGDVSGHGTPAAVMMAITHTLAHSHPGPPTPPAEVLSRLNRALCQRYTGGSGTFVTAFYGILSPDRQSFRYSSAGHNPPRLVRAGAAAQPLADATSLPLGIDHDSIYEDSQAVRLEPGDALVLYTDGIVEAMNPTRELFGYRRLDAALTETAGAAPGAIIDSLFERVDQFRAARPFADDRTVLAAVIEA
jgi:sigma-B regulation protein RsbU (phosphoserine phosphatase)